MNRYAKLGALCLGGAMLLQNPGWADATAGQKPSVHPLFAALRNGYGTVIRTYTTEGHDLNVVNADGETPLMYAAMYSTPAVISRLLVRRANVNAKTPNGTTALMLATGDIEKVKLLVENGADVNARSVTGRNALMIAASRNGGGKVVEYLLAHGADPNTTDTLQDIPAVPAGAGGSTVLVEAAKIRDGQAMRALIAAGADLHRKDASGADPISAAALNGNLENVRFLLGRGARVDARVARGEVTLLMFAAWQQDPALARLLLDSGADVNATDAMGNTALLWSAYNDFAETATTEVLLAAKADINQRNKAGESALDLARRRGESPLVRLLLSKGATGADPRQAAVYTNSAPMEVREAVEKSLALLQKSSPQFFKVSGCVSCHNQSLPEMALSMARARNLNFDPAAATHQMKTVLGFVRPAKLALLEMGDVVPDMPITGGYLMLGLAADNYPADSMTDAVAFNLAAKQLPDGSWRPWAPRPPLEYSAVTATALSMRVLQLYGPQGRAEEFEQRVNNARRWLRSASPRSNEEKAMRLLGLYWAKAPQDELARIARDLAADQREDGGFAQLPNLASDAYATGQAAYALRMAGGFKPQDSVYRRASAYLLRTQHEDGSWQVVSRSFPLQPYKESGFPHGKDQWISAAGTSWAAMALMLGNATPAVH